MEAAIATEKPARVRMKGNVIEAKPLLIPAGSTKKKKTTGFVKPDWRTMLSNREILPRIKTGEH